MQHGTRSRRASITRVMSLPPDTGSVERRSCSEYVAQLLATGKRVDKRAFGEVRVPTIVRESMHAHSSAAHTERGATKQSASVMPSPRNGRSTAHAAGNRDGHAGASVEAPRLGLSESSSSSSSSLLSARHDVSSTSHANGLLAQVMYSDAYGSCVMCAVHGVFGPPREHSPAQGRLNVRVSAPLLPHRGTGSSATHTIDGGGGGAMLLTVSNNSPEAALALLRVEGYVQRVLESCVDLRQLGIRFGEACWVLVVHVTMLSVDGGLRAAALHAAVAALHGLVLPRARLPDDSVVESRVLRLGSGGVPVVCSFGVVHGDAGRVSLISDTTAMEEHVLDGSVTVTVDEEGGVVDVCHAGRRPISSAVVQDAVRAWMKQSKQIHKVLLAVQ